MPYCLGIDTSNYTTSCALYDLERGTVEQRRRPLRVLEGQLGLRQNDAVFLHNSALPDLISELLPKAAGISAVGVSDRPRRAKDSYMPCFCVGAGYGRAIASALGAPLFCFSHQEGHIASALYSVGALPLLSRRFLAFHVSGGTTELVLVSRDGQVFFAELIGRTLDISAGQLIDRTGLCLGLSFPCGAGLSRLAEGAAAARPASVCIKGGDCCLSGVENLAKRLLADGACAGGVAAFVLESVRVALEGMLTQALKRCGDLPVLMAGGVMASAMLRDYFSKRYGALCATPEFAGDNAAGAALLAGRAINARKGENAHV